ncbi:MAG TPA: adenylosuccinate synthase [Thermoplasmata archaeon]|nr:adenylosuccinate synthase [Thermoplasmata archaeon]
MSVSVVVGAQYGDEGKGRITDFLAEGATYVVRTGGGPNAGHTIQIGEEKVVLHQLSCGVLRAGATSVCGPGMNIDPFALEEEIAELDRRHLLKGDILVSERAHVILPLHRIEDEWEEALRSSRSGGSAMGTTGRGIGPSYEDRYGRWGLRFGDLTHPERLRSRLELLYARKRQLEHLPPIEELSAQLAEVGGRLAPRITETEPRLWDAIAQKRKVILEGAQSALLDIDFGSYPYVTSSHPTAAGALMGSGIPPTELDEVVGVLKAYSTRVGEGPFPTEGTEAEAEYLRREGQEHGATTGRPRRCGWLDLVLLRYAVRLNGFTSLAVTKVDTLGGLEEVPVAIAYESPTGEQLDWPPAAAEELAKVRPVYRRLEGWPKITSRLRDRLHREGVHALPSALRRFLEFIEERTQVPVEWVGHGPRREETLWLGRGRDASRLRALENWAP